MPVGVVTNEREEHKWERAKQIAAEEGHEKDWQYIMGIYKKMNPNRFKTAAALLNAALYKEAYSSTTIPSYGAPSTGEFRYRGGINPGVGTAVGPRPPVRPTFRPRPTPGVRPVQPNTNPNGYGTGLYSRAPQMAPVLGYTRGSYNAGSSGVNNFYEDSFPSKRSYGMPGTGNGLATAYSDPNAAANIAAANARRAAAEAAAGEAARRSMAPRPGTPRRPVQTEYERLASSRNMINYGRRANKAQRAAGLAEYNRLYNAWANNFAGPSQRDRWRAKGRSEQEITDFVNKHVMRRMAKAGINRPNVKGALGTPLPVTTPRPTSVAGVRPH